MKCPYCTDTTLVMTERQGVEIDYCPSCRGVWLDRGELDKLLDRAAGSAQTAPVPPQPTPQVAAAYHGRRDFEDSDLHPRGYRSGTARRKSWLSDIFD